MGMKTLVQLTVGGVVVAVATPMLGGAPAAAAPVRWAAVSVSPTNQIAAWSNNQPTREAAERAALDACDRAIPGGPATGSAGGSSGGPVHDCQALTFASGQCAAVASSRVDRSKGNGDEYWYSWSVGRSLREADYDALAKARGDHAHVVESFCQN
jgi:hypothetical protein